MIREGHCSSPGFSPRCLSVAMTVFMVWVIVLATALLRGHDVTAVTTRQQSAAA